MFNGNIECCSSEQRETLLSANPHTRGKKTIFKKFAIFLVPFLLTPFSSLLTPSVAHAQTVSPYLYWTKWDNCHFNLRDYTPVSVRIYVRSDFAARATRFQYGNNSELIRFVEVWEGREVNGQTQSFPSITINTGNQRTFILSQDFNPSQTWISNLGSRYVYVKLYNADGRTCISKIPF